MYRGDQPTFCRGCGDRWAPGAATCGRCGEPVVARLVDDGFGRKLPAFTRQDGLVRALTVLTIGYALTVVAELAAAWAERDALLAYLRTDVWTQALFDALVSHGWWTLGSSVAYLGVIVLFGVWLVRAGRNLRALGVIDTRDLDEARLLWFFVPVLHLYRPLLGVRQLWQGSRAPDPRRWQQEPTSLLLWGWWLLWLASNALGDASLYLMSTFDDTATRLTGTELDLGWALTRLLCVPLFLAVVWGIERAQARRAPAAAART